MNEEYIYNSLKEKYSITLISAIESAKKEGYKFVLFNERVYFINEEGIGYDTGIKENDIFIRM